MSDAKFTKGPWYWEVNKKQKTVYLCGRGIEVLRFERWGMQGAAPTFTKQDEIFKLQGRKACDVAVDIPGREHHSHWCQKIDHPDAHLIAAAPEMYDLLDSIENDNGQVSDWLFTKIQEVLAKARGES